MNKFLKKKAETIPENIEELRDKVINRGGTVCEDIKSIEKKWKTICLRIPTSMMKEIDSIVEKRVGMNRTAWILEAIQQKLEKQN